MDIVITAVVCVNLALDSYIIPYIPHNIQLGGLVFLASCWGLLLDDVQQTHLVGSTQIDGCNENTYAIRGEVQRIPRGQVTPNRTTR